MSTEISRSSWHYRLVAFAFGKDERIFVCPNCHEPIRHSRLVELSRPRSPSNLCSYMINVALAPVRLTVVGVIIIGGSWVLGWGFASVLLFPPQFSSGDWTWIIGIGVALLVVSTKNPLTRYLNYRWRLLGLYLSSLRHRYCLPVSYSD